MFIPGAQQQRYAQQQQQEINAYVVPNGKQRIEYSFRPTTAYFQRPHILRANGNRIFVGEIDENGGVLWAFEIQSQQINQQTKNNISTRFNQIYNNFSETPTNLIDNTLYSNVLMFLSIIILLTTMYFLLKKCCCGKYWSNKSPQDVIDRKVGFLWVKNSLNKQGILI